MPDYLNSQFPILPLSHDLGVAVLLRLRLLKGGGWNEQKELDLYFYPEEKPKEKDEHCKPSLLL